MSERSPSAAKERAARGWCCVCGYSVALRRDGNAQNHAIYDIGFGGASTYCNGGGRAPLAAGEKAVWETPRGR